MRAGEFDALQAAFPACDDAPLALALLGLLADGRPVSEAALAQRVGRPDVYVAGQLTRWPNLQRDADGAVVAFGGLTLRDTVHAFSVRGRRLHAWCAWDTLFLPALLEETAAVRSACPASGTQVDLQVAPGGVERARPAELYVSFPPLTATDTADITGSFCCHVFFLAGSDSASAWISEHPGGRTVDLATAYELGVRAAARLLAGDAPSRPSRRRS